jgi:hypothetical protein
MATVTTYTTRNNSVFYSIVYGASAEIANQLANRTADIAARTAPKRSGNLSRNHYVRPAAPTQSGKDISALIYNDSPYAEYVYYGTGERGGGSRITSQSGKRMVWKGTGKWGPGWWSAMYTQGQKPNHWMVTAYNQARVGLGLTNITAMRPSPEAARSGEGSGKDPTMAHHASDPRPAWKQRYAKVACR